jgi:hypothetical protein
MGKIEELIIEHSVNRSIDTTIQIGEVWDRFYNGSAGILFRALVNARIKEQVSQTQDNVTSAERRLGRAEGFQMIQDDIEMAIAQMNELTKSQVGENV